MFTGLFYVLCCILYVCCFWVIPGTVEFCDNVLVCWYSVCGSVDFLWVFSSMLALIANNRFTKVLYLFNALVCCISVTSLSVCVLFCILFVCCLWVISDTVIFCVNDPVCWYCVFGSVDFLFTFSHTLAFIVNNRSAELLNLFNVLVRCISVTYLAVCELLTNNIGDGWLLYEWSCPLVYYVFTHQSPDLIFLTDKLPIS